MNVLIIAEHNGTELNPSVLNTITAGKQLGEVDVLVAGRQCQIVAETTAKIDGVEKVLLADAEHLNHQLAEELSPLIVNLADNYDYILTPATNFGKNLSPRVAALLDVAQISDITSIISADTFVRPIYAGNAMATVQSHDAKKVITVRTVNFDAAKLDCFDIILSS